MVQERILKEKKEYKSTAVNPHFLKGNDLQNTRNTALFLYQDSGDEHLYSKTSIAV